MYTTALALSVLSAALTIWFNAAGDPRQSHSPVEWRWRDTWTLFVDAGGRGRGDGSASAPFQRIQEAIERAREIRDERLNRILIRVAPGEYREDPVYLDVSNVELRGSTRLVLDEGGRPKNCGPNTAPTPCVERGTETVIAAVRPVISGQVLLLAGPTKQRSVNRLADVTISGFIFDGLSNSLATAGWAVLVDRVDNFLVSNNAAHRVQIGIFTRLSSGRIERNFAYNSNDGIAVSAGSEIYRATVEVRANRLINHLAQAALALGAGGSQTLSNDPYLTPVQTVFDPAQRPEEVPNTLEISLIANDMSHNPAFGFRFQNYPSGPVYDTIGNQTVSSHITGIVRHNLFTDNGEYGLTVEGAFAARNNPRRFTGTFTGLITDNDFSRNGRTGIFAGFMLNGVVTRNPGLINTNKYLVDGRFLILTNYSAARFDYDNPLLDPSNTMTPLNNELVINGVALVGKRVTCPAGLPCAP